MSNKSNQEIRRKYDPEFKADVLKMVESGRPVHEIAQSLGIKENLIYQWRIRSKAAKFEEDFHSEGNDLSEENERLKAELRKVEQERDILKKALGIFSR
jgi:transposase